MDVTFFAITAVLAVVGVVVGYLIGERRTRETNRVEREQAEREAFKLLEKTQAECQNLNERATKEAKGLREAAEKEVETRRQEQQKHETRLSNLEKKLGKKFFICIFIY